VTPLAGREARPGKSLICCARVRRRRCGARGERGGGKRGSGERARAQKRAGKAKTPRFQIHIECVETVLGGIFT
jgi:hypothetical protein